MKRTIGITAAALAALLAIPAARAADDLPDQSLSDYKVGETLLGDEVKEKDLEGRVVVIEYWGTR
ncbi:MAG: hypothetical protein HKN82_09270 [Akkermansiaceae bacterium]|nr:hypothetical protein [Akkermansiaceae bacterium]NNM28632.1 hypothetical protein [Akkermansiaceae bacterium]